VVAGAIHFNSSRKSKPYIKLNCAAIPSELLESELFGHRKGSFTGAIADRKGKFIEVQGTAEREPFSKSDMDKLLALADKGIKQLIEIQKEVIGKHLDNI